MPLRFIRFAKVPLRPAGRTTAAVFVGGGGGSGVEELDENGFAIVLPIDPKHMIIP